MLVDTSVWIDFFNGFASKEANKLALAIADGEPISLPGIVLTEILLGLKNDADAKRITSLLDGFDTVDELSKADYLEAARIYRVCRAKGLTVRSTIDCFIARLCIRDELSLLTKDKDFAGIAKHLPLKLVVV